MTYPKIITITSKIICLYITLSLSPHATCQVEDPDLYFNLKQAYFSGKKTSDTFVYDDVTPFSNGKAWVRVANKWGMINAAGGKVYPFVIDQVHIDPKNNFCYPVKKITCGLSSLTMANLLQILSLKKFTPSTTNFLPLALTLFTDFFLPLPQILPCLIYTILSAPLTIKKFGYLKTKNGDLLTLLANNTSLLV